MEEKLRYLRNLVEQAAQADAAAGAAADAAADAADAEADAEIGADEIEGEEKETEFEPKFMLDELIEAWELLEFTDRTQIRDKEVGETFAKLTFTFEGHDFEVTYKEKPQGFHIRYEDTATQEYFTDDSTIPLYASDIADKLNTWTSKLGHAGAAGYSI